MHKRCGVDACSPDNDCAPPLLGSTGVEPTRTARDLRIADFSAQPRHKCAGRPTPRRGAHNSEHLRREGGQPVRDLSLRMQIVLYPGVYPGVSPKRPAAVPREGRDGRASRHSDSVPPTALISAQTQSASDGRRREAAHFPTRVYELTASNEGCLRTGNPVR